MVNATRRPSAVVFNEPKSIYDVAPVSAKMSGVRTRVGYDYFDFILSIELPKSITIQTEQSHYEIEMTSQLEPDYEGSNLNDQSHFVGSFKKLDGKDRAINFGLIHCDLRQSY